MDPLGYTSLKGQVTMSRARKNHLQEVLRTLPAELVAEAQLLRDRVPLGRQNVGILTVQRTNGKRLEIFVWGSTRSYCTHFFCGGRMVSFFWEVFRDVCRGNCL